MKSSNKAKGTTLAYLAAIGLALIIGFSFLFVKIALEHSPPISMLAFRLTLGFICSLIPVLTGKVKLNLDKKALVTMLPAALCFPFFAFLFQTLGLQTLPTAEAGMIQALTPVFTLLLSAVFIKKEKAGALQVVFTLFSVVGVILMVVMNGISAEAFDAVGTVLLLLNVICGAAYFTLTRKVLARYSWYSFTVVVLGFGAVAFNIVAASIQLSQGNIINYFSPLLEPRLLLSLVPLGVGASFLSNICANYATSKLEAPRVAVFNNLAMLVTMLAGVFILGEQLRWFHLAGSALIIAGVFCANFFAARAR